MLRRAETQNDERSASLLGAALGLGQAEAVQPVASAELETPQLPHDHPKWAKDIVTISQRARELLQRIKPVVIKVMTFWDHRLRSIGIGTKRVSIDASGSYRLE